MPRLCRVLTILVPLTALVGCSQATLSDSRPLVEQTSFDFTLLGDRALFVEQDLGYVESVGPYAIYRVTGPSPRLVGPRVHARINGGWVMLCGATDYYRGDTERASSVSMELVADESDVTLATAELRPLAPGGCTNPDDQFTEIPEFGEGPDFDELAGDVDAVGDHGIALEFDPPPPIGSEFLVRRAAVDEQERDHNGAPASVPRVCCEGGACDLM